MKINVIVELVVKYDGKPLLHAERNATNLLLAIIESSLLYPFTFKSMEMIFSHTKLQLYFFLKKKKKKNYSSIYTYHLNFQNYKITTLNYNLCFALHPNVNWVINLDRNVCHVWLTWPLYILHENTIFLFFNPLK